MPISDLVLGAVIGPPELDRVTRKKLFMALRKIAPEISARKGAQFVAAAGVAIGVYRRLYQEVDRHRASVEPELRRIAIAGEEFAAAINSLNPYTAAILRIALGRVDAARCAADAGRCAGLISDMLDRVPKKSRGALKSAPALSNLIRDLGLAYIQAFGKKPSASRSGVFYKILDLLSEMFNIEHSRETRLTEILKRQKFEAPPPKSGPRKQLTT